MSRLQLLLEHWRLTLGMLQHRVRENRVGDAWRFQPLIKVYSFLIKRYGEDVPPVGLLKRLARAGATLLGILFVIGSLTALWLHVLTGGQFWDWLRDRLAE
jgi:hypothetical protein